MPAAPNPSTPSFSPPDDPSMSKHVVILGGGLAGLSCGFELVNRGAKVTVLEREPAVRLGDDESAIIEALTAEAREGDHVLLMSNGAFGAIHTRLLEALGTAP